VSGLPLCSQTPAGKISKHTPKHTPRIPRLPPQRPSQYHWHLGSRVGAWGLGCPCKSQGSSDKIPRRACQKPSRNPPETNYGFSVQSRKQPKTRGGEKALART
jgi:hypothetical protein